MTSLKLVSSNRIFGGDQRVYSHESKELSCEMKFAVFLPPQAQDAEAKLPVLFWLSGLTCTEANFVQKAGGQRTAAELGVIIVCPDTSPRNVNLPGEEDSWDFGSGAGFYVDASEEPWKKHYRMFSYVTRELLELVEANFPCDLERKGVFGHSMGGHGALVCALKNPGLFRSVSTFAAIANPINCPWGQKAFTGYLGANRESWKSWDATELVKTYNGPPLEVFLDQGDADQFLKEQQLLPDNLAGACRAANFPFILRTREGYDHSYFYIASFVEEHIRYHFEKLQ
ncbi:S-formylglutathione hydrolase [Phlebotomus argentipes]|uniref:S-formylglutathione hydrolase n=1 Tax=Phlebotomus argentipes TaxID=94469 RepID=UPI002892B6A7|nr:S-formylglutathione hydrolase [Phlebotomus argentipes]